MCSQAPAGRGQGCGTWRWSPLGGEEPRAREGRGSTPASEPCPLPSPRLQLGRPPEGPGSSTAPDSTGSCDTSHQWPVPGLCSPSPEGSGLQGELGCARACAVCGCVPAGRQGSSPRETHPRPLHSPGAEMVLQLRVAPWALSVLTPSRGPSHGLGAARQRGQDLPAEPCYANRPAPGASEDCPSVWGRLHSRLPRGVGLVGCGLWFGPFCGSSPCSQAPKCAAVQELRWLWTPV